MKRHSKRFLSLLLSVAMFFGVISYSTVALAAELNTIRFSIRVGDVLRDSSSGALGQAQPKADDAILDVDNQKDADGNTTGTKTEIEKPDPVPEGTEKIALPEVKQHESADPAGPTADQNDGDDVGIDPNVADGNIIPEGEKYEGDPTSIVTDREAFEGLPAGEQEKIDLDNVGDDPVTTQEKDGLKAALEKLGVIEEETDGDGEDPAEDDKEYLVQTSGIEIEADKSAAVITKKLTEKVTKLVYDANGQPMMVPALDENGEPATDTDGNPVMVQKTEEVEIDAGTIEVVVEAKALGDAQVFTEEDGELVVSEVQQQNVVLTIDVSGSMDDELGNDKDKDKNKDKWIILCESVKSFVETLYGGKYNKRTQKMEYTAFGVNGESDIILDLIVYASADDLDDDASSAAAQLFRGVKTLKDLNKLTSIFYSYNSTGEPKYKPYSSNGADSIDLMRDLAIDNDVTIEQWDGSTGTNTEAGYKKTLEAVQNIILSNGGYKKDAEGNIELDSEGNRILNGLYDPSNITVVFMTDGEATLHIDPNGKEAVQGTGGSSEESDRHEAADEAVKILKAGANLFNIVIGKDKNQTIPGGGGWNGGLDMNLIKDYMDPDCDKIGVSADEATKTTTDAAEATVSGETKTPVGADAALDENRKLKEGYVAERTSTGGMHNGGYWTYYRIDSELKSDDYTKTWKSGRNGYDYTPGHYEYQKIGLKEGYYYDAEKKQYFKNGYFKGLIDALDATLEPGEAKFSDNADFVAAETAEKVVETYQTFAQRIVEKAAKLTAVAYDAKVIDVVPAGYDVIIDKDSGVRVVGKNADGTTTLEWDIGILDSATPGGYTQKYFLLPNNKLGDFQFGTSMIGTSAVLYCKPIDKAGEEIAIVLENPVVTLAAEAGNDPKGSYCYGDVAFNAMDNDSKPENKLEAAGTQVQGTFLRIGELTNKEITLTADRFVFQSTDDGGKLTEGVEIQFTDGGNTPRTSYYPIVNGQVEIDGTKYDVKEEAGKTILVAANGMTAVIGKMTGLEKGFYGNKNDWQPEELDFEQTAVADGTQVIIKTKAGRQLGTLKIMSDGNVKFEADPNGTMTDIEKLSFNIPYELWFKAAVAPMGSGVDFSNYGESVQNAAMTFEITGFASEQGNPEITIPTPTVPPTVPPTTPPTTPTTPPTTPTTPPVIPTPAPTATPTTPPTTPPTTTPPTVPTTSPVIPAQTIVDDETPLAGPKTPSWALLNLLLTIGTAVTFAAMMAGYIGKKEKRDGKAGKRFDVKKHGGMRLFSSIPGIGAIVAFILTEDMTLPMTITDEWTLLMVAIAVIQAGVVLLSVKHDKETDAITADING